jgi:hypothetical protein
MSDLVILLVHQINHFEAGWAGWSARRRGRIRSCQTSITDP